MLPLFQVKWPKVLIYISRKLFYFILFAHIEKIEEIFDDREGNSESCDNFYLKKYMIIHSMGIRLRGSIKNGILLEYNLGTEDELPQSNQKFACPFYTL